MSNGPETVTGLNAKRPAFAVVVLTAIVVSLCALGFTRDGGVSRFAVQLEALEVSLIAGTVDTIISEHSDSATVCLEIMADSNGIRPAVAPVLRRLRSRRDVTTSEGCPRTYASMIQLVDSLGQPIPDQRPEGYVDPYRLRVGRPQFEHPDVAWLYVRQFHGMSGRAFVCVAREEDGRPRASCRVVDRWVS